MLAAMPPDVHVKWQQFHAEEPYWWEQLRFMLARICELIANTTDDAQGNRFLYRGEKKSAMTFADFIPTAWIAPTQKSAPSTKDRKVLRGMASHDAQAFLTELGSA